MSSKLPVDFGRVESSCTSKSTRARSFAVRSTFLLGLLLLAAHAGEPTGPIPADAHLKGMWSAVAPWPVIAIHAVLLPEGRVLTYGTDTDGKQTGYFTYDVWDPSAGPAAGHLTLPNGTGTDIFCGSQLVLPQSGAGVLLAGGDKWTGTATTNSGNNNSNIFNYNTDTLTRGNNMNRARWYSTATTLTNGEVYIQGGSGGTDLPEIRAIDGGFRLLSNANTSELHYYYPRNFVAPDGRVFGFDSRGVMYYVDTNGLGSITTVGQFAAPYRGIDASAAMFQPGRILQFGGASNGAIVIDITGGGKPAVTPTQSMSTQRRWATSTLLADGKVLATGGSSVRNQTVGVNNAAEIWDPNTGTWTLGAVGALARLYHSTALMLPDATVLVAGGGAAGPLTNLNVEIYYPPYLFGPDGTLAPRPSIALAPDLLPIGEAFAVDVAGAAAISRVTLVKTGSVTHSWNMEQRFLELTFSASGATLAVQAPTRTADAPPGTYLLFVIDSAGVPSEGRIVRIETSAAPIPNAAPIVDAGADRAITLPSSVSLTGTATDDGRPNPPGLLTRNWTKVSGPGTVTFSAPTALTTAVSFSASGFYVLRLTASDGAIAVSDDVTITVNPAPVATGTGLTGRYYNGISFNTLVFTRTDPTVNFTWGSGSPGAGVNPDGFSVRWTGQVQAPVSGTYTFSTVSNDGVRLWVNGQQLINNWTVHGTTTDTSAGVALVGGVKYAVTMEFFENAGWGQAQLLWAYPGRTQTVIPNSQLYPAIASTNQAPIVNAGADQTITLPGSANLSATATDDGQPGALTTTWSRVSGPGTVTFGNANAPATTASFSAAGVYTLRLSASDGAAASSDDVTITVSAAPSAAGSGLTGSYYNGVSFNALVFTRTDPTVNFTWGSGSPGAGVNPDGFSVRWTGQVQAPVSGNYTFSTVSNDGVRLWVNGQAVINNWTVHGTTTDSSAGVALAAGVKYAVTMEFFENAGWGQAQLMWAYPGQARTVIPQSQLTP